MPVPPESSFAPEPSLPIPSEDADKVVGSLGTDSGTPTPPTQQDEGGPRVVAPVDIVALDEDEEAEELTETGPTKRAKQHTSIVGNILPIEKR